jgi:hypothetical protein
VNVLVNHYSPFSRLWVIVILLVFVPDAASQQRSKTQRGASGQSILSSKFFRDDTIANRIIGGAESHHSINEFPLVSGNGFVSTESFAYRVLSAIRQLGYTPPIDGDPQPGKALLNKFQRLNGLPISDLITKELLLEIDGNLRESEAKDAGVGPAFPLYSRLTSQVPLNEPSREHFARLLDTVFRALPAHLVPYSLENFHNFYRQQLPYFVDKGQPVDAIPAGSICDINYYPEFSNDCLFRANSVITLNAGEFEVVGILLHEYAHWLDGNLFPRLAETARGGIGTLGFYGISYDTAAGTLNTDFRTYYPLRRDKSVIATEFVSAYARGHEATLAGVAKCTPFEDFAESFGLYVQGGRIFRYLAERDMYLREKYDWLQKNVFAGVEYETGAIPSIELLRRRPTSRSNIAFNVNDFGRIDPDHIFQYEFPRLRQTNSTAQPPNARPKKSHNRGPSYNLCPSLET